MRRAGGAAVLVGEEVEVEVEVDGAVITGAGPDGAAAAGITTSRGTQTNLRTRSPGYVCSI